MNTVMVMGTSLLAAVIASAAKQSRDSGLLRRFAPRNDDGGDNTRLPDNNASAIIEA